MSKTGLAAVSLTVLIGLVIILTTYVDDSETTPGTIQPSLNVSIGENANVAPESASNENRNSAADINRNVNRQNANVQPEPESTVVLPIGDFYDRVTLKRFGTYITEATSPVQPERFSGYHAGSDAEATSAAEKDADVPVFAAADGTIVLRKAVSGYGGVVMVESAVNGETVTFLYGHVRLSSIAKTVEQGVKKGERLGVLGTGFSSETDGERKHLHFAILKGKSTRLTGYVSSKSQLSPWYDPENWLKDRQAREPD